ncbi:MAG: response regulator [Firmicutes bacterium]|nr:response regulator [Bacillota bacterium]
MLKVVIIDDEPLVLEGLRSMIHWDKYGFTICGQAMEGEEGIKMIKATDPDLVMTDIRMPVMNGLEVIKYCREQLGLECEFVILSGYSDFKYVKTAMYYKSSDYILKPIDADEVHEMLGKLRTKILKNKERINKIARDLEFVTMSSMIRIIKGESKKSLIDRVHFILGLNEDDKVRCILMKEDINPADEEKKSRKKDMKKFIKKAIGNQNGYFVFREPDKRYYMIISEKLQKFYNDNQLYTYLQNELGENGYDISMFVGGCCKGIDSVKRSYEEALICEKHQFYNKSNRIIEYDKIKSIKFETAFNTGTQNDIIQNILSKNNKKIRFYINHFFEVAEQRLLDPQIIIMWIKNLQAEIFKLISKVYNDQDAEVKNLIEQMDTLNIFKASEIKNQLITICQKVSDYLYIKQESGDIIEDIKHYIKNHYKKDIKIAAVAKIFNFNPNYLGQLIQKKVGMKYNDYLNKVRIDKAKELLKRTDMRVNEIAAEVGYKKPDYFAVKFKEYTGVSPSNYTNKS